MKYLLPCTLVSVALSSLQAAPPDKFTFLDLQPQGNQKVLEGFGGDDGNNLKSLGKGQRTFEGVGFKIGEKVIQLGSSMHKGPDKAEGIKVGKTCAKIHILHATQFGNGQGPQDSIFVADGTKIAEYKVRYDDDKTETISVVYGDDVRDWWFNDNSKDVKRGKVVWKGDNDYAKDLQHRVRLYMMTWENPHPDKKIVSIDYSRAGESVAAPFCVAITVEAK
jgi:hypothetical protein